MATTTWDQKSGMTSATDVDNLESYADQAEASKDAAAASATSAATSAAAALASETASDASETASAASAAAASTSATSASTSETNAASSASTASTAATTATNQATAAATSATNAATSETNAAASATAAASSASSAQSSADAALAALDDFDDRYLGQKASDPTLDNDGNALVAGALYFNTTDDVMKVYEGSTWVAAYASLSGALLVANNLSDLANASAARTNLGLGTAATSASTDFVAVTGDAMTGDLSFGDNNKAIFGAGSDLQIYHDGLNSYIQDAGIGDLKIRGAAVSIETGGGNLYFKGDANVASLYHTNLQKLATTSTGVNVTGTVTAEALRVGTSSPSAPIDVVGSPGTLAEFRDGVAANFIVETSGAVTTIGNQAGSSQLAFKASNSEAMRIDASGRLLVGKTAPDVSTDGFEVHNNDYIGVTRDGGATAFFNRRTSDGAIVEFRKDNTTVGSIGTDGGDVYIGTGDTTLKFVDGADLIAPTGTDAATRDGVISLGNSSNRFNDLYLSGGVYLGGTGSNNYLDDYEHGIYTVTITPATSGTVTLDTVEDSGTYVKIGNLVHVSAKIEVASVSSPVGTAFISLPFAIANVNENSGRISGSVAVQNIAFTGDYLTAFGLEGNSHFQLQQVVSNGTWVALSASALGSGDDIQFTFTYRTTD